MTDRKDRLRRLVVLQNSLRTLHETRHATHLAEAAKAGAEAAELARRFDEDGSLGPLFPDVYHRRIAEDLRREGVERAQAVVEARQAVAAKIRGERADDAFQEARRADERRLTEAEGLELVERRGSSLKPR